MEITVKRLFLGKVENLIIGIRKKCLTWHYDHAKRRKTSIPALLAGRRPDSVSGEFSTPGASLVYALLLPQLDQRLLADHGADSLWGQESLLRAWGETV